MKNLKDIFDELSKNYEIDWTDENEVAFNIYFEKENVKYRIYVDADYVGYFSLNPKLKTWMAISHDHYDEEKDFDEIYSGIIFYLRENIRP